MSTPAQAMPKIRLDATVHARSCRLMPHGWRVVGVGDDDGTELHSLRLLRWLRLNRGVVVRDVAILVPEPTESEMAASALRGLDAARNANLPVRLSLGGSEGELEVPSSVLAALTRVLDSFAHGEGVALLPAHAELTTQQAADLLNVSRPFLIGLLDAGVISHRRVGTHRRVNAVSLARYLREDDARRTAAADELAAEAHVLGLS